MNRLTLKEFPFAILVIISSFLNEKDREREGERREESEEERGGGKTERERI